MARHQMLLVALLLTLGPAARAADCPQWGRDQSRNMVSPEKNLPATADPGTPKEDGGEVDPATTKNVLWVAKLGSQSYGNTIVAGGQVYIGTNNAAPRRPSVKGDLGILLCLEQATGNFLWQLSTPKLGGRQCERLGIGRDLLLAHLR